LLAHYRPVRPWCSLILGEQTPLSLLGTWHGNSLLFPMETLFERYVEACLRGSLAPDATLTRQASSEYLTTHQDRRWFMLKPDFLLKEAGKSWVMDAKWKRIDQRLGDSESKYGLSQADFYQMFAYGQRYLNGIGELFLIYPQTSTFNMALPPFDFSPALKLSVVPFDLEKGQLACQTSLPLSLP
jgi:5-methylcytosine-specific restriction enzyme subunit McrC